MNNHFYLFIGSLMVISCANNDPQTIIRDYIAAHNEHDVKKTLEYFHEEVVFDLRNTWTKSGIEEISALEVWDSTLNSHLKLESMEIQGDSIFCKIIENNDWFSSVNITDLAHDPTIFILKNKKIEKIIAIPDEETGKEIQQVIGSIIQWSQLNNDSTIFELILNGQFVYSSKAAVKWLDLFDRWKTTQ